MSPVHPDPETAITYRHRFDTERYLDQVVFPDSGAHDALRSDPDWERVDGTDPVAEVAAKTPKVDADVTVDELAAFSLPELRQYAGQRGVGDPARLETREEAIAAIFAEFDPTNDAAEAEGQAPPPADDLNGLTRDELNEVAVEEGVVESLEDAEAFDNKKAVAEAIRAHRA